MAAVVSYVNTTPRSLIIKVAYAADGAAPPDITMTALAAACAVGPLKALLSSVTTALCGTDLGVDQNTAKSKKLRIRTNIQGKRSEGSTVTIPSPGVVFIDGVGLRISAIGVIAEPTDSYIEVQFQHSIMR